MLLALLAACAGLPPAASDSPPAPVDAAPRTVVLVSLDGFRADRLDLASTPTLDRLAAEGLRADALVPPFPSKTFPSHYTQVTGLTPAHHGVINNGFYDPERGDWFSMTDHADSEDGSWWGGEPIWVTAGKAGLRSATAFWPGSEAEIAGGRPTYYLRYTGAMSFNDRVDRVLSWLDLPEAERPQLLTLYLDQPDGHGHAYGPEAPQVLWSIAEVDRAVGRLVAGLEERGRLDDVDLLVVSDHGMAEVSEDRVVMLDDVVDVWEEAGAESFGTHAGLRPDPERVDEVLERLATLERARCSRKEDLPAHLAYVDNPRIPSVICLAEEGWQISTRDWVAQHRDSFNGGSHGYDPALPSMHGVFVARGPHLARGRVGPVQGLDLYELLCALLELTPAPNDGDREAARALLAP